MSSGGQREIFEMGESRYSREITGGNRETDNANVVDARLESDGDSVRAIAAVVVFSLNHGSLIPQSEGGAEICFS